MNNEPVMAAAVARTAARCLTVVGIAAFAALHLAMAASVDPLRQPVSSYALSQPGTTLFAVGSLAFACACAILTVTATPPPHTGAVRAALAVAAVSFVLVVVFRTDHGVAVASISGQIHRYSAGAAFVALTVAGLIVSKRLREGATAGIRRWIYAMTAASLMTLLVTAANTFLPDLFSGGDWRGMPQRVLLVVQALLIIGLSTLRPAGAARAAGFSLPRASTKTTLRGDATPVVLYQASIHDQPRHTSPEPLCSNRIHSAVGRTV